MAPTTVGLPKSQTRTWLPFFRHRVAVGERIVGLANLLVKNESDGDIGDSQCALLITNRQLVFYRLLPGANVPEDMPFRTIRKESITEVVQIQPARVQVTNFTGAQWELQFGNEQDAVVIRRLIVELAGVLHPSTQSEIDLTPI